MRKIKTFLSIALPNGLIFLFGLFLFTACGKSNSDQPKIETTESTTKTTEQSAADSIGACSLLTKEEVKKIIGRSVLELKKEQAGDNFYCAYRDAEMPGSPPAVTLSITISRNAEMPMEL